MPLNEEKILILKMLEEGKISSDEAAKLLEALGEDSNQPSGENTGKQQKQSGFQDEVYKMRQKIHDWKKEFKGNYNQNDFDKAVEDFTVKAEKLAKNVATTTFGIVDKMVDYVSSFVDTNSFNIFGSFKVEDRSFEAAASEGMDLYVEGANGSMFVKRHSENKIIIKSRVRSQLDNADSVLLFDAAGPAVALKLNRQGNISVSHEIYIPELKFKSIKLETSNGRIYVEGSLSEVFEGITRNSHIELMGVDSEKVRISTKNARIQVSHTIGREIDIDTSNSLIDIKHIKAEKIRAFTKNGRILLENVQNIEGSNDMQVELSTANGGIKVNMNDMDNKGYKVKARTTNGGINLLIPDMVYSNVSRQGAGVSFAEAESKGFESAADKVRITADTVNGFIEVVK